MKGAPLEAARAAKSEVIEAFAGVGDVVGVGLVSMGDGYGLKVNLAEAPARDVLPPREISGVPIRIEVVGTLRKRSS
jgi:hypothetical protein